MAGIDQISSSSFGSTDYEDPPEALTRLQQTTIVVAYHEAFEQLSHRLDGLSKKFQIGNFIARRCNDIRLEVKIKQPSILFDAISMTRLIEENN